MATFVDLGVNTRENGIAFSLGAKTTILSEEEVDRLIAALKDMKPQIRKIRIDKLKAEIEDHKNAIDLLKEKLDEVQARVT